MKPGSRRIALKVDCDTFEGTKTGIPRLLEIFGKAGIRASFFFTLGPDRSGLAIRRIFTQKGFLKKMLRSNAVSLYGPKTMLYGTLLPAPMIGQGLAAEIRSVAVAGHEVGVHGWDHVRWHDRLDRLSEREMDHDYRSAHQTFQSIFGRQARASAAPGWHATPSSLALQESFGLLYASDTRGGSPFFPSANGRTFKFLEIPTTLPTWDEAMADPAIRGKDGLLEFYRGAVIGTEVHTIHTEVEGGAHSPLFERQLAMWKADGCTFLTMEELANETLLDRASVPAAGIERVTIPNRGGFVTSRVPGHASVHP